MIHEYLLPFCKVFACLLLFMAVFLSFSCFYIQRFCKKTRVDESADLSGDMPDHVFEKMKEEFNELMPMESCSLDKTLEDIVFEPSALEADEKSPCHTTKIIPLVPRLQQKKARQNRKANTTMNTHLTILLAALFFASCGRASNQDTFDRTGRPTQGTLTPEAILERTLDDFFGAQTPSQHIATPELPPLMPTQAGRPLPSHINRLLSPSDVDWLHKTLAEANAIQTFALQQMASPGAKPDAAFLALSPMHQQSAMTGVSLMQQLFPQVDPCTQDPLDMQELD